jgi:hypothetical protein
MRVVNPGGFNYDLWFKYIPLKGVVVTDKGRVLESNGVTTVVLRSDDGMVTHSTTAICSQFDNFSRSAGRVVCLRKLSTLISKEFCSALWKAVKESGMELGNVPQNKERHKA